MKRTICLVIVIFLSALACMGCNKSVKNAVYMPTGCTSEWAIGTPNPLVYCVPADAPLILATQRGQTFENYGMQTFHLVFGEFFRPLRQLMRDFETTAVGMGLNPNGKLDAVFYVQDRTAMLYFTAEDEKLVLDEIDAKIKDEFNWCQKEPCDIDDDTITIKDEQGWHIYSFVGIRDYHYNVGYYEVEPMYLGARAKDGVVMLALWYGKDIPSGELVVPPNPYMPTVEKNDVYTAHLDYGGFGEYLFRMPLIAQDINYDYVRYFATEEDEEKYDELYDNSTPERNLRCHGYDYDYSSVKKVQEYDEDAVLCSEDSVKETVEDDPVPCTELVKIINTTSISDDVCISEFKSIFENIKSVDMALSASDSGKIGMRISGPVFGELKKVLEDGLMSYNKLDDASVNKTYGYFAFKLNDLVSWANNKWNALESRNWKCAQIAGKIRDMRSMDKAFPELRRYTNGFESVSFLFRDPPTRRERRRGEKSVVFLGYMRHNTDIIRRIVEKFFDIDTPLEYGKVITEEGYDFDTQALLNENEIWLGTPPYDLTKQTPKIIKENLMGAHVSQGLINMVLDDVPGFVRMSLLTEYQIDLAMRSGRLEFTITPKE